MVEVISTDSNSTADEIREKVEIATRSVLQNTLRVEAYTNTDESGTMSFEPDQFFPENPGLRTRNYSTSDEGEHKQLYNYLNDPIFREHATGLLRRKRELMEAAEAQGA